MARCMAHAIRDLAGKAPFFNPERDAHDTPHAERSYALANEALKALGVPFAPIHRLPFSLFAEKMDQPLVQESVVQAVILSRTRDFKVNGVPFSFSPDHAEKARLLLISFRLFLEGIQAGDAERLFGIGTTLCKRVESFEQSHMEESVLHRTAGLRPYLRARAVERGLDVAREESVRAFVESVNELIGYREGARAVDATNLLLRGFESEIEGELHARLRDALGALRRLICERCHEQMPSIDIRDIPELIHALDAFSEVCAHLNFCIERQEHPLFIAWVRDTILYALKKELITREQLIVRDVEFMYKELPMLCMWYGWKNSLASSDSFTRCPGTPFGDRFKEAVARITEAPSEKITEEQRAIFHRLGQEYWLEERALTTRALAAADALVGATLPP